MDKYDKAIAYLTEHPDEIATAWLNVAEHPAGCLFQFVKKDGFETPSIYGCLTQVKTGFMVACTPELTDEIRNDPLIPTGKVLGEDAGGANLYNALTLESLPHLANWQRRLDKEIRCSEEHS